MRQFEKSYQFEGSEKPDPEIIEIAVKKNQNPQKHKS